MGQVVKDRSGRFFRISLPPTMAAHISTSFPFTGLVNDDIGGAGVHGGTAISFPGYSGGEYDIGQYVGFDIDAPGSFMVQALAVELGYYWGMPSVSDLAEPSAESSLVIPVALVTGGWLPLPVGPSFSLVGDHSGIVGFRFGIGFGFGFNGSASYSSVISARHGFLVGWDDL